MSVCPNTVVKLETALAGNVIYNNKVNIINDIILAIEAYLTVQFTI